MLAGEADHAKWDQPPGRRVSPVAVASMVLPFVSLLFLPPIGVARVVPDALFTATAWLILLLPVAAIVLGIAALVQIRRSGGTRTGWPLALAGIVSGIAVEVYIVALLVAALGALVCSLGCL